MNDNFNAPWRLMAATIYGPAVDCKIYGTLDVDVTDIDEYIKEKRRSGVKITLTHFVTAALGRAIAKLPEMNCHLKRGRFVRRDYIEVTVAVNTHAGQQMSFVKIGDAHLKSVTEISDEIREKAFATRQGSETKVARNKYTLTKIPWPLRRPVFRLLRWIVNDAGINLGFLGLTDRSFGSIMLTNIGSHGLTTGMPALFPAAKLPAVIVMGKVEKKPVVRDNQIVIRKILPLTGVFDHRVVDGRHGGLLARYARLALADHLKLDRTVLPEDYAVSFAASPA